MPGSFTRCTCLDRAVRVPHFSWFPCVSKFSGAKISAFSFNFSSYLVFYAIFLIFCQWPLTHTPVLKTACIFLRGSLKVHSPIFQNLFFCFIWRIINPKKFIFQISVEMVNLFKCTKQFCILLQLPISYCVRQTDSFSLISSANGTLLAVKFSIGYEKNMGFLVIAKSPKVWKKSWKDRTGLLLKVHTTLTLSICALVQI